jgi:hypothetical protein
MRRLLRVEIIRDTCTAPMVASLYSVSRRTLSRHLKAEGRTFRQIANEVRSEIACMLLAKTNLSVAQIAEALNYSHHRWPSIMVVLARPNYRNFDADGNEIPLSGGASTELPRALRLPLQKPQFIEVAGDAPHGFRGIRIQFKTPGA